LPEDQAKFGQYNRRATMINNSRNIKQLPSVIIGARLEKERHNSDINKILDIQKYVSGTFQSQANLNHIRKKSDHSEDPIGFLLNEGNDT